MSRPGRTPSGSLRPDTSKVEMTLSILESQTSLDMLHLASNHDLLTLFKNPKTSLGSPSSGGSSLMPPSVAKASMSDLSGTGGTSLSDLKDDEEEVVVLSCEVFKLNEYKKTQERVLVVSNKAVYNFIPGSFKKFKRKIVIEDLDSITLSQTGDHFVIHVQSDYSYWFTSPKRTQIVRCLNRLFFEATENEIPIEVVQEDRIDACVVTKIAAADVAGSKVRKASVGTRITKKIRGMVSKKKTRFREGGYDLDLTYINDRIIAMGYPSDDLEGLYRNPYPEVYAFLEEKHQHRYKVYNLCSERKYDPAKFHRRVARYPFDDHNVPPLKLVVDFCEDANEWLSQDPRNIIAVHCKAGKGRTGLMISCFLFYNKTFTSVRESLEFFGNKRTKDGKGVTIPSQKRWCEYFERLMKEYLWVDKPFGWSPGGAKLVIKDITLNTIPHFDADAGCDPYVMIYRQVDNRRIFDSRDLGPTEHILPDIGKYTISFAAAGTKLGGVAIQGGIQIKVFDADQFTNDDNMFSFWLHTAFMDLDSSAEVSKLTLSKTDLDKAAKDKLHKYFDEKFSIEISYYPEDPSAPRGSDDEEGKWEVDRVFKEMEKLRTEVTAQQRKIDQLKLQCEELLEENKDLKHKLDYMTAMNDATEIGDRSFAS